MIADGLFQVYLVRYLSLYDFDFSHIFIEFLWIIVIIFWVETLKSV
jgi:hypothetical protein